MGRAVPLLRSRECAHERPPRLLLHFHCSAVVISAEDKVDHLEAGTALLPQEAAELDVQQQEEAAVAAEEPAAQQEVVAVAPAARHYAAAAAAGPVAPPGAARRA